jgi:hypothetical protein
MNIDDNRLNQRGESEQQHAKRHALQTADFSAQRMVSVPLQQYIVQRQSYYRK